MLRGSLNALRLLGMALVAIIPFTARAQKAFTYTATDIQTFVVTDRATLTIPVTTVIIIAGGPAPDFSASGPTDPYSVTLRPPQGTDARLVQAMVDGRLIQMSLTRTNSDGEYEAIANIPRISAEAGQIHILWTTKDAGYVETLATGEQVHPTLSAPAPRVLVNRRKIH